MLKRAIRWGVRTMRRWMQEEPVDPAWLLESDFVSEQINYRLLHLLKKQPDLRPHFGWGVLQAAQLAKSIGIPRISAIEFGVAGGNGLVSLERTAAEVEQIFGIG